MTITEISRTAGLEGAVGNRDITQRQASRFVRVRMQGIPKRLSTGGGVPHSRFQCKRIVFKTIGHGSHRDKQPPSEAALVECHRGRGPGRSRILNLDTTALAIQGLSEFGRPEGTSLEPTIGRGNGARPGWNPAHISGKSQPKCSLINFSIFSFRPTTTDLV